MKSEQEAKAGGKFEPFNLVIGPRVEDAFVFRVLSVERGAFSLALSLVSDVVRRFAVFWVIFESFDVKDEDSRAGMRRRRSGTDVEAEEFGDAVVRLASVRLTHGDDVSGFPPGEGRDVASPVKFLQDDVTLARAAEDVRSESFRERVALFEGVFVGERGCGGDAAEVHSPGGPRIATGAIGGQQVFSSDADHDVFDGRGARPETSDEPFCEFGATQERAEDVAFVGG